MSNSFCQKFSLEYPLIVAPMAGGPSSVDLVVASSQEGALGSIGAAYMTSLEIQSFIQQVRQKTKKPFSVNLFIPQKIVEPTPDQKVRALQVTKLYRQDLKLTDPTLEPPYEEDFDQQFEMVLRMRPQVLSFVFGILSREHL